VARDSRVRGVRLEPAVDAWLVGWAEKRGVSVSEALRLAVELLVAGEDARGVAGRLVAASRPPVAGSAPSRAELFAGLRVPVSVRGRRVGEARSGD
jgi:hypothetical protein